ncbi:SUN domain-containing protein 1-like [Aplochiton taeniatus]
MDASAIHLRAPSQVNTGYTYAHSSSYCRSLLDPEKEQRTGQTFQSPRMSRRSLRLHTTAGHYGDDSQLDSSLNHSNLVYSASYSAGGPGQLDAKGVRSRHSQQHSVSCSHSVLQTPHLQHLQQKQHSQSVHTSSLHSLATSDASLLSSMLDSSCIQERTLVDRIWGLDEDADLQDSSHLADHSTALANSTLLANGDHQHHHQTQTSLVNGYSCRDSAMHSDRKEALTAYSSSSKYTSSSLTSAAPTAATRPAGPSANAAASPLSTVYHRDKSRKPKTGPLKYLWDRGVLLKRRAAASVLFLLTLLYQQVLLRISRQGKARTSCCGSMNIKVLENNENINGSLCDVCKGKQRMETSTVFTSLSSWAGYLFQMLWRVTAYTGSSLLWSGQKAGSTGWAVIHILLSALWLAIKSPGKTASDSYGWLRAGWYRLVTFMSWLNVVFLTRCLPKLLKLLLCLLPLLILYGLWWWDSSSLLSVLPAVNMMEWSSPFPLVLSSSLAAFSTSQGPAEDAVEHAAVDPAHNSPLTKAAQHNGDQAAASSIDSERLLSLEHSLSRLWERVEGSGQKSDQQHAELVQLHQSLQQQLLSQTERASLEPWVAGLLEERLALLRGEMEEEEEAKREQTQELYLGQQQSQASRLADLEAVLQNLTTKTEEVQRRQETITTLPAVATTLPVPVSMGVDRESHEALLAEVQRLEKALGGVKHDLQGLMGCRGQCERLGSVQDVVSAQVEQEVRALLYRSHRADSEDLPESLLRWLSERFVSGADLQTSLASLERRILQNLSLLLDQEQQSGEEKPCPQTLTQTVLQTVGAAGATMTKEHVQLIVKNALRIYSQDRTGLVDYALETGGGSILSTRCSETYETKTALMSLFGLPLWYFTQSPRVVIQPDVHPGNCWAFKGSNGYLVIRLSMKIRPTAFSMEHIPKALAPSGTIISAPRQFTVYGLDNENQDEGKLLGSYTYEEDGDALQTYPVTEENDNSYQIIEVRVLSNWGHQEYTCLYRIRVHGEPCND